MPTQPLLSRLAALEADVRYQEPAGPGEEEFRYTAGRIPVLFSAPHGAKHLRLGAPKDEDEFTAGFARLAAELSGAHVLYARRRSDGDPNYDDAVPYKQRLAEIVPQAGIGFVIDLHGAKAESSFGIELGTMSGRSCPGYVDLLRAGLEAYGFRLDAPEEGEARLDRLRIDEFFTGAKNQTVVRFAWEQLHTPAVQVELNAHLRVPRRRPDSSGKEPFTGHPPRIERALAAFAELAARIAQRLIS